MIAGLACQEVGASLAVLLFPAVGPLGMVMLRLVFSAIVLLVIARPRVRGHSRSDWTGVMSLAPATAALAGFIFLGQHMTWLEIAGIALVIAASIGAVRSSSRAAREAAEPIA